MSMTSTSYDYDERQQRIAAYLAGVELTHGVGLDEHHACTISAINLALTGRLHDDRDECMSSVVHRWVIPVQDAMPEQMLAAGDEHGDRWRAVLPLIAGSTDGRDGERRTVLLDWMWRCLGGDVVPSWVPEQARDAWAVMLRDRTAESARKARDAAYAAAAAATAAAYAATAAAYASNAAAYASNAAAAAVYAAAAATAAAADAAYASNAAETFWRMADPATVLAAICLVPATS